MSTRSILWIEIARTICIAIVVLGHVIGIFLLTSNEELADWAVIYSCCARVAVPFFFLISGFMLRLSFDHKPNLPSPAQFAKSKFLSLGIPFFIWNILYMLFAHFTMHWILISWNSLFTLFTGFIHLFFLFVLFQFFLIYYPLHKFLHGRLLILAVAVSALCSIGFVAFSEYFLWIGKVTEPSFEWHYGKLFFGWAVFFFLGIWFGERPQRTDLSSRTIMLLSIATGISLVLYFLETKHQITVFGSIGRFYFLFSGLAYQVFSSILLLGLIKRMEKFVTSNQVLNYLVGTGKETFAIYIAHYFFAMVIVMGWKSLGLPGVFWLKIPVVFLVTWILTQGFVRMFNYSALSIPGKLLFGFRS